MREHADRAGSTLTTSIALSYMGWNLIEGPLPIRDALARCDELRREAAGLAGAEASLAGCRAALASLGGQTADAAGAMAAARERLARLGLRELNAYLAVIDSQCLRVAGEHAAAERALRAAEGVWIANGDCWMEAIVRVNVALAILAQGRLDDAAAAVANVEALPSPADRAWMVKRHVARAGVASAQGRHAEATAEARAAVAATAGTDLLLYAAEAAYALAAALEGAGNGGEAAETRAQAVALDRRKGVVRVG